MLRHLFISFHCWLSSGCSSQGGQKPVFCDALTAGIGEKRRNRTAVLQEKKKKKGMHLSRKMTSDGLRREKYWLAAEPTLKVS